MNPDFEELYVAWYARIKNFAYQYLQSENDAEDVVQDVFMRLLEQRNPMHDAQKQVSYLFASVKNACLNLLKSKLAMNAATLRHRLELQLRYDALEYSGFNGQTPENLEQVLHDALEKLPERCRRIFVMSKLQGMKQQDIARELNISVNTVETQMGVAYKKLRVVLKDYVPLLVLLFYTARP